MLKTVDLMRFGIGEGSRIIRGTLLLLFSMLEEEEEGGGGGKNVKSCERL